MNLLLEVCAGSITSALNASKGGAQRVELCDNLSEGGTTPSPGIIKQAVRLLDIPVFVLIRPRSGDFLYSNAEFEAMKEDVLFCREQGAKGVVLGVLNSDGSVDLEHTSELIRLANPMEVTFHRAFDMTPDPFRALEDIIGLGIARILTSGQAASAPAGSGIIAGLITRASGRVIIMPGGGINEVNIIELQQKTKAVEFHASLRNPVKSKMKFKNDQAFMGATGEDDFTWQETDPQRVRKLVDQLCSI
jgi:copper homeostasis protein